MSRRRVDPVELIRRSNPVQKVDRLPGPDSPSAQALLEELIGSDLPVMPPHLRPRRSIRRTTLAAAVVFVVLSATTAIAAGLFSPDPEDVKSVLDQGVAASAVHLPGWRPELSTEAVWCMYGPSQGAWTAASEYPLDQPLTLDLLIAECAGGNDVGRSQATTPTTFTACRGVFAEEAYRQRMSFGGAVVAGDLEADRPGFPVVLAWEADCRSTILKTSWPVVLEPLDSLDDVNVARQIEIELKAESARRCVTGAEAEDLAREAVQSLGIGWLLIDEPLDVVPECYEVLVEAEWGLVIVLGDDTAPLSVENASDE